MLANYMCVCDNIDNACTCSKVSTYFNVKEREEQLALVRAFRFPMAPTFLSASGSVLKQGGPLHTPEALSVASPRLGPGGMGSLRAIGVSLWKCNDEFHVRCSWWEGN